MPLAIEAVPLSAIEFAAESRLRSSSYLELHNLDCIVHEGGLTLRGRLSSYYHLQVALSLVGEIEGVDFIDNQVSVIASNRSMNP